MAVIIQQGPADKIRVVGERAHSQANGLFVKVPNRDGQGGALEFSDLADAIVQGYAVTDDRQPLDRLAEWRNERPGVVWDGKYSNEKFGDVKSDANASYQRGQSVMVSFRGGHPKNNLRTQDTFLKVQKKVGSGWETISNDWDWDTLYKWNREGSDRSLIEITWNIPSDAEPGSYRIVHQGDWKNGWTGRVKSYSGKSRTFSVN